MEPLSGRSSGKYTVCDHIKKKSPNIVIDAETIRSFTTESNVLPLFEKRTFDYSRMKYYSLQTNERLRCRWDEFLRTVEGRKRTPFQFPNANDFHFFKFDTRYEPSQSLVGKSHRRMLSFGQGADARGHTPVPNDMHTRNTVGVKKPRAFSAKKKMAGKKGGLRH